jgi:outer membrane protein assembly factor BamB
MNIHRHAFLVLSAALILLGEAAAQEWTRFRGPNGSGVSESKGVPVTWTEKDFRWRVAIPGDGDGQPVIWGDKLFVTSAVDKGAERMLLCLSKEDGKELWSKKLPMGTYNKNKSRCWALTTPAVDKDHVFATFADEEKYLVKAYDHAGKELWTVNLGPFKSQHGMGASPMIFEEKLIVMNDQDGDSCIVALDLKSGKTIWKCARRGVKEETAYCTPTVLQRKGFPTELLTTSFAHGISSVDPKTGTLLWEAKVFDKRAVSSPVVVGDLVFGTCGSGGGGNFVAAVRLGGKGDVTSSHLAYTIKKAAPYVPTPLSVGDRLYLVSDDGVASAVEAATGKIIWSERVGKEFFSSPVLIDGKVYIPSTSGEMVVFATGEEFKLLSRNPLGEGSRSTPCVDGDRIYVKTFTHLVCLGGK